MSLLTPTCFGQRSVQKGFCRFITQLLLGTLPMYSSICSPGNILLYCKYGRPFFALNSFKNALCNCTKLSPLWNNVQLYFKLGLLVFCASAYDGNLVYAIKHFIIIFFRNDFFVRVMLKALWQGRNCLWVRILNNLVCVRLRKPKFVHLVGKNGASSTSFLVLKINYVPIIDSFSCGKITYQLSKQLVVVVCLTLRPHLYIWKVVERVRTDCRRINCRNNIAKQHLYVWEGT